VFGEHSKGEVAGGLSFHGEAGQVVWNVTSVANADDGSEAQVTMKAHLPTVALEITRTFSVKAGCAVVKVEETMKNLVGFERAMGRAQHVTFGKAFLKDRNTRFNCNADIGHTWREPLDDATQTMATDVPFEFPNIPAHGSAGNVDWREYPRTETPSADLCTMRLDPKQKFAWMLAENTGKGVTVAYVWEREAFPWLVTW
jgi:D-hexose-6-phosphate mutarotase